MLLQGDCLEALKTLENDSIDSLVTDPPAGISFMGKDWDDDKGGRDEWIAWLAAVMRECLRVMKPGAHGLIWAIPRTSHWTATALEDAGFEIRDVVTHLFGSGFPKSMNIGKAIDNANGAEREIIGLNPNHRGDSQMRNDHTKGLGQDGAIRAPSTDLAKQWQGWGTALKPASEHWILVRKPCSEKTVAKNVEKWGCGAINIDGSRIGTDKIKVTVNDNMQGGNFGNRQPGKTLAVTEHQGRFPANLVLSHSDHCTDEQCDIECAIKVLDEQSGVLKTNPGAYRRESRTGEGNTYKLEGKGLTSLGSSGGASRFFYCAKASKADKNNGLDESIKKSIGNRPNSADMTGKFPDHDQRERVGNFHPTVKSSKLMRYLIKLVTPPNGIVLDPFMGSGSTGVAAKAEGFQFVGIERDAEYFEISTQRISFDQ